MQGKEKLATINAATPFVKLTYNLEEIALLPCVVMKLLVPWMLLLDKLIILIWKLWLTTWLQTMTWRKNCQIMCAARSDILLQSVSYQHEGTAWSFKAAWLFSPAEVQQIKPSVSALDTLSVFPFPILSNSALKEELPLYVAASEDILILLWPIAILEAAWTVFTCMESDSEANYSNSTIFAAASECVFALLANSFGKRQNSSL